MVYTSINIRKMKFILNIACSNYKEHFNAAHDTRGNIFKWFSFIWLTVPRCPGAIFDKQSYLWLYSSYASQMQLMLHNADLCGGPMKWCKFEHELCTTWYHYIGRRRALKLLNATVNKAPKVKRTLQIKTGIMHFCINGTSQTLPFMTVKTLQERLCRN